MNNENLAIESFISYCDDMMIAEESFKPLEATKRLLQKLKDMIMTLLRKIKSNPNKIYMPREAYSIYEKAMKDYNESLKIFYGAYPRGLKSFDPNNDISDSDLDFLAKLAEDGKDYVEQIRRINWNGITSRAVALNNEIELKFKSLNKQIDYLTDLLFVKGLTDKAQKSMDYIAMIIKNLYPLLIVISNHNINTKY